MQSSQTGSLKTMLKDRHRVMGVLRRLITHGACIFLGVLLCLGCGRMSRLQKQNVHIAHKFYFSLNALCGLDNIKSINTADQKLLFDQIDELYYALKLCAPYAAFTQVYGDDLSADEIDEILNYLQTVRDKIRAVISSGALSQEDALYFERVSSMTSRALMTEHPLETLCSLFSSS